MQDLCFLARVARITLLFRLCRVGQRQKACLDRIYRMNRIYAAQKGKVKGGFDTRPPYRKSNAKRHFRQASSFKNKNQLHSPAQSGFTGLGGFVAAQKGKGETLALTEIAESLRPDVRCQKSENLKSRYREGRKEQRSGVSKPENQAQRRAEYC
jgi:hypothetical protein